MMMMFIGTETLVTQLVYERSRMNEDRTELSQELDIVDDNVEYLLP